MDEGVFQHAHDKGWWDGPGRFYCVNRNVIGNCQARTAQELIVALCKGKMGFDMGGPGFKYSDDRYCRGFDLHHSNGLQGDILNLPLKDNCLDFIVSFHVLEHVEDIRKAISEFIRVLKHNGLIYAVIPDKRYFKHNYDATFPRGTNAPNEMEPEEMLSIIKEYKELEILLFDTHLNNLDFNMFLKINKQKGAVMGELEKDDFLTTEAKEEIAKCRELPVYPWKNEWDRWGFDHIEGETAKEINKYWIPRLKYTYDTYWENQDQAGIGMQETIITDGFYPMPENKMVLDVGAGRGDLMKYLATQGKNNVVIGLDAGLEGQKLYYKEERYKYCTLLYLDVSNDRFPFPDNVFDVVFFTETIEHLPNPMHALMEIKRVLKENADLVITFPEAEDQKGYWHGAHPFVYPGLFYRKHFRRFMIQMFFKQVKYFKNGDTGKYVFKNIKDGFINPVAITKGDWKGNLVYKDIRRENEDLDKEMPDFTREDMLRMNEPSKPTQQDFNYIGSF